MFLKKVLLITYHFPPSAASGAFRMLGFARHLPASGWQPIVVAPPTLPWEPVDQDLVHEIPPSDIVERVDYPSAKWKLVRYLAQNAVWLPHAWFACKRMIREHRPDVILTSGPPHCVHMLGHYLKRSAGLPWVADFRDPWVSDGTDNGLLDQWGLWWERCVFRNANLILANAPNACRLFQETYPAARDRIVTLTNGFDPREETPPCCAASSIRLLHAGELYAGRDPLPLLEAIAQLNAISKTQTSCELHIAGRSGLDGMNLPQLLCERGWSTFVRWHGQLPYKQTLAALDGADILVLFDSPGRKMGVPAKLYEYLATGRPILALAEPDGDVAAILQQSGVPHRIAPPRDTMRIQLALRELCEEVLTGRPISNQAQLKSFTRAHLAGVLAGMLDSLIGPRQVTMVRLDRAVSHPGSAHINHRMGQERVMMANAGDRKDAGGS